MISISRARSKLAKGEFLEDGGVDKEKWSLRVRGLIIADRFAYPTRHNPHKFVVLSSKDTRFVANLALPI